MKDIFEEVVIHGEKTWALTIIPNADNEYAPVAWKDQHGNIVAMIVAHELATDGTPHRHLSLYTCKADRSKRMSRVDLDYGTDIVNLDFEGVTMRVKSSRGSSLLLQAPNSRYWKLQVDDAGNFTTVSA